MFSAICINHIIQFSLKNIHCSKLWYSTKKQAVKNRLSPLDEIVERINEEFYGEFNDTDKVIVDTLHNKIKQDTNVKCATINMGIERKNHIFKWIQQYNVPTRND